MSLRAFSLGCLAVVTLTGCHSVGPGTIPRDRLDYSEAITDSWKLQVLRNIVKLRYLDAPIFLEVSQIVSGYSLETSASVGGGVYAVGGAGSPGNNVTLGASGTYSDHPTITYTPMTGDAFLKNMIDPVPPRSIFHLLQSGYAADFMLELGVHSLNGLRNRSFRAGKATPADPGFVRAVQLFLEIQQAGAIQVETTGATNTPRAVMIVFGQENLPLEISAKIQELKRLLKLAEHRNQFALVESLSPQSPAELAVGSRSMMQMMLDLATYVEVPAQEVAEKRAVPVPDTSAWAEPLLRVHWSPKKPEDAFAAVWYRKHWFWVGDQDWRSKRTLSTLLFLSSLNSSGSNDRLPQLTIPAR